MAEFYGGTGPLETTSLQKLAAPITVSREQYRALQANRVEDRDRGEIPITLDERPGGPKDPKQGSECNRLITTPIQGNTIPCDS